MAKCDNNNGTFSFDLDVDDYNYVWIKYSVSDGSTLTKSKTRLTDISTHELYLVQKDGAKTLLDETKFPDYVLSEDAKKYEMDLTVAYMLGGSTPKTYKWDVNKDGKCIYTSIDEFCKSMPLDLNKWYETDPVYSVLDTDNTFYSIDKVALTSSALNIKAQINGYVGVAEYCFKRNDFKYFSNSSSINQLVILPQSAKVEVVNTYPKENNKYALGGIDKKWSNIYTDTLNSRAVNFASINGDRTSSTISPYSNNSGYLGTSAYYWLYAYLSNIYNNNLYTDTLKTKDGSKYHLGNLTTSSEMSTKWSIFNSNNINSETAGGTIYWNGLIVNSYPRKYAILTGSARRDFRGNPSVVDKVFKFYLPYSFSDASYGNGTSYFSLVCPLYQPYAGANNNLFGSLPLVRVGNSGYNLGFNRGTNYFFVSGDTMNNDCTGFQVVVIGVIQ